MSKTQTDLQIQLGRTLANYHLLLGWILGLICTSLHYVALKFLSSLSRSEFQIKKGCLYETLGIISYFLNGGLAYFSSDPTNPVIRSQSV